MAFKVAKVRAYENGIVRLLLTPQGPDDKCDLAVGDEIELEEEIAPEDEVEFEKKLAEILAEPNGAVPRFMQFKTGRINS